MVPCAILLGPCPPVLDLRINGWIGSGLNYFHARYYDPAIGAFTSVDTQDGRCYVYVHDNPETYTDPNGYGCGNNSNNQVLQA